MIRGSFLCEALVVDVTHKDILQKELARTASSRLQLLAAHNKQNIISTATLNVVTIAIIHLSKNYVD